MLAIESLFNAQIPIDQWHERIGKPTIADTILDRIVNTAHQVKLNGHSLRKNFIFLSKNN